MKFGMDATICFAAFYDQSNCLDKLIFFVVI